MAAGGWVQAAETGQVNWTTVTKPTVTNTAAGFEIWRMNDSLQATAPVFMKIEYGSGSNTAIPGLWITVGSATNGAGTLSGTMSTRVGPMAYSNAVNAYPSRFRGDTNSLAMCLWQTWTASVFICVERQHDHLGADTPDGFMLLLSSNTVSSSQFLSYAGNNPSAQATWNSCMPPVGTGAYGADIYVYPIRCFGKGEPAPFLGFCNYFGADLTVSNPVNTAVWDGTTKPYLPTGAGGSAGYYGGAGGGGGKVLMRWD